MFTSLAAVFLLILDIALVLWLIKILIFGSAMIFGAPYVISSKDKTKSLIKLIKQHCLHNQRPLQSIKAVDLGSGNGHLVIELAKNGIETDGYEINPLLVWKSRHNIRKAIRWISKGNKHIKKSQLNNCHIYNKSFLSTDLSKYDLITVYGNNYVMQRLKQKLQKEATPGTIIISNYFKFTDWKPTRSLNEVYLYITS